MKKFFKTVSIVAIVLVAALVIVPLVFKPQIVKKIKSEVNKSLYAKVEWNDVSISLLKGFPDLSLGLKDLSVVGINDFKGHTLVSFDEFSLKLALFSVFSGNIKIKSIFLDKPVVNAITLKDGRVNYDIVIPDTTALEIPGDTAASNMVINLKRFEIRDARIYYKDFESNMSASFEDFDFVLSGDMSADFTDLNIASTTSDFNFTMDGLKYISSSRLVVNSLVKADLVKYIFTFGQTDLKLNDLNMAMEGTFGMPNDTDMDFDIRFFSRETAFKTLLSMVPAIYTKDFAGLKTSGTLSFGGDVKGRYNNKQSPGINLTLLVSDGFFAYPGLPKSVENVNIDIKIFYDGVYEDNTKVDVNKFHLELAGNPFDMQLHIITPMSDMQMNGLIKGRIDMASLADVIPMEGTLMEGTINTDLNFMGKMSDIDNENYEAFKADGLLEVMNFKISGKGVPMPVLIERSSLTFSPQFVNLTAFDAIFGKSDIHMNGKLENFIPYVFKNETIKGSLNFTSANLDLNELMADETTSDQAATVDTSVMTVIEVPKNVDFVMQADLKKVLFDKLSMDNLVGKLIVKDGKVVMDKLSLNMLGGSMFINGEYNTQDITTPMIDLKLSAKNIDIPSAFKAFEAVQKLAPIAGNMNGNISTDLVFASNLDSAMGPVYSSMVGYGLLQSDQVKITKSKTFEKIAEVLKNDKFKDVVIQDINASFEIRNGRIYLKPFDTKVGPAKANIGGDQGMDQTMNYIMALAIPKSEFGGAANDLYQGLLSQATSKGINIQSSENLNVKLNITGTFSDPKIGLGVKESMEQSKTELKEAIQSKVKEEVKNITGDVKAKAGAEIDKIMKEAETQAANVKTIAAGAGAKLVSEAKTQGDQLVKEAGSNPLKKAAAQKTAESLNKKAREKSDALNKEAELKANTIMVEARKKADALKAK